MTRPTFSCRDLKREGGITISAVLPVHRLDDGQCFALFSGWALHCLLDEGHKGHHTPCVIVLDEMSQIGYSKAWLDAFSLGAGVAGVQIVAVYQSVGQIVEQFKKAWRNVVQNCGVTIWFGARDSETQKTVSDLTGMVEVHSRSKSLNYRDIDVDPQMTESVSQTSRPFMYPADVGRLNDNEMICFVEGVKVPIKAIRKPYTKVFSGYSPNPYYDGRSRFGKWFGGRK